MLPFAIDVHGDKARVLRRIQEQATKWGECEDAVALCTTLAHIVGSIPEGSDVTLSFFINLNHSRVEQPAAGPREVGI